MMDKYIQKLLQYKLALICSLLIIGALCIVFLLKPSENIRGVVIAIITASIIGILFEFFFHHEFQQQLRAHLGDIVDDAFMKVLTILQPSSIEKRDKMAASLHSAIKTPLRKGYKYSILLKKEFKEIFSVFYYKTVFTIEYEIENILPEPITLFPNKSFKVFVTSSEDKQLAQRLMVEEYVSYAIYLKELNIQKLKENKIERDIIDSIILEIDGKSYNHLKSKIKDRYIEFNLPCDSIRLSSREPKFVRFTITSILPELKPNTFRAWTPYPCIGAAFSFASEIPNTDIAAAVLLSDPLYKFRKTSISYEVSTNEFVFPGNGVVFMWSIAEGDWNVS